MDAKQLLEKLGKQLEERADPDLEQDNVALTFEEHVVGCLRLLLEHPEIAGYKAVFAGNELSGPVYELEWLPTIGHYDYHKDLYIQDAELAAHPEFYVGQELPINAVC